MAVTKNEILCKTGPFLRASHIGSWQGQNLGLRLHKEFTENFMTNDPSLGGPRGPVQSGMSA